MKMSAGLLFVMTVGISGNAYAEQSPEDAYTACLIGNAVIERYKGVDQSEAVARAWVACVNLKQSLKADRNVLDIYDFVYSVLRQMPEPMIGLSIPEYRNG